jgi:hypothetical protein
MALGGRLRFNAGFRLSDGAGGGKSARIGGIRSSGWDRGYASMGFYAVWRSGSTQAYY